MDRGDKTQEMKEQKQWKEKEELWWEHQPQIVIAASFAAKNPG